LISLSFGHAATGAGLLAVTFADRKLAAARPHAR